MAPLQIALIWGAVSSALFSFPAQSGEWENFKDLKEALVRSSSRRDVPLPSWASGLVYQRGEHWYDPVKPSAPQKPAKNETIKPSPADVPADPEQSPLR